MQAECTEEQITNGNYEQPLVQIIAELVSKI